MKYEFEVDQKVFIKPLEVGGRVCEISIDRTGTQYKVRFFDNCAVHFVYFWPDELEARQ